MKNMYENDAAVPAAMRVNACLQKLCCDQAYRKTVARGSAAEGIQISPGKAVRVNTGRGIKGRESAKR